MYLRKIQLNELQNQIEPLYGKQLKCYERFFMDEDYSK